MREDRDGPLTPEQEALAQQLFQQLQQPFLDEALRRVQSNDPVAQRGAAAWFAENPPLNDAQKARVDNAGVLTALQTALDERKTGGIKGQA